VTAENSGPGTKLIPFPPLGELSLRDARPAAIRLIEDLRDFFS
jgi:hypothetical protein